MNLQIGTVDGLVNITPKAIYCFVNAINAFSKGGVKYAREANVSLGIAFQRFVEPVYTGIKENFDLKDIFKPAYTTNNKEQSPARVTFCKKMGLLKIDDSNDVFELTPLAEEIRLKRITIEEYAFILLTKQGIFIDGNYVCNLFSLIAQRFEESTTISDIEILDYIKEKFEDADIEKTRADIIINALCTTGLIAKITKGVYVLSNTLYAEIFKDFQDKSYLLSPAYIDKDDAYIEYMGEMKYGIFDVINNDNKDIYLRKFPNLIKYVNLNKDIMNKENISQKPINEPLQQIFYGAPGTGKSKTIKDKTEIAEKENRVFRTTFHPDSDYSTFVGCYKPGMKSGDRIYSAEELAVKLKEIKNSGVTYPCHKFAAQYWRSLKDLSADAIKQILNACGFTESMNVEVSKGVAIGQEYLNKDDDGKIVYTFTPQAFTNAYVKAWSTTEDVYLIIEEINRGNCAQIFGDLFQLLDRGDNGLSEYPIEADTDLRNYIAKELENSTRSDFPNGVKEGEKLILPSNLYIWATMNTSDQSLFPIDSAFKRRWDWQYVPIHDGGKGWQIKADGKRYDWWQFVDAMNNKIGTATYSEDKKLGYFFCKAKDGVIDAETFVGKVVFYVWNDVFKDFAEEAGNLFKDVDGSMLSFNKFYTIGTDGKRMVVEPKIAILMQNLGVEPITTSNSTNDDEPEEDEDGNNPSSYNKNYDKFSVNGEGKWGKNRLPYECLKKYVEMNPGLNANEVLNNWKSLNVNVPHFVESKEEYESRTDNSKRSYYVKCGDTIIYVAHNGYGSNGKVYEFMDAINNANWGIKLAKVMA